VVRTLEPSGNFGAALAKLESKISIHGSLKKEFGAIYGFPSDESGTAIRCLMSWTRTSTKQTLCSCSVRAQHSCPI
jgi:hypothetical protein